MAMGTYSDSSGTHGFLDSGGSFTRIDVPGAYATYACGINDSGQIVGYFNDATGGHGFVDTGGSFTTIDVPGATYTEAHGINGSGQIVGHYTDSSGHGHAFLATPQRPPSVRCLATPNTLWPPNGKSVVVTVSGTITSDTTIPPGGNTYAVIDEYGQVQPTGSITLSADGSYSFGVSLVATRNGDDQDVRTYTIVVSSRDTIGNNASCSAVVTVPHDQGK
jgi:probable HAF family extracellular repeat protein